MLGSSKHLYQIQSVFLCQEAIWGNKLFIRWFVCWLFHSFLFRFCFYCCWSIKYIILYSPGHIHCLDNRDIYVCFMYVPCVLRCAGLSVCALILNDMYADTIQFVQNLFFRFFSFHFAWFVRFRFDIFDVKIKMSNLLNGTLWLLTGLQCHLQQPLAAVIRSRIVLMSNAIILLWPNQVVKQRTTQNKKKTSTHESFIDKHHLKIHCEPKWIQNKSMHSGSFIIRVSQWAPPTMDRKMECPFWLNNLKLHLILAFIAFAIYELFW